jgi:hypothetical protein
MALFNRHFNHSQATLARVVFARLRVSRGARAVVELISRRRRRRRRRRRARRVVDAVGTCRRHSVTRSSRDGAARRPHRDVRERHRVRGHAVLLARAEGAREDARGRARTRETRIKDDDGDAMVFEFNDDATTRARRESARTRTLTNAATIRLQTGV